MLAWFGSLPILEQVFFYIALPATVILIIQTILLFLGNVGPGSGDSGLESDTSGMDFDTDGADGMDFAEDVDVSGDAGDSGGEFDAYGLRFFTVRGVIAFLTIAGWAGICCVELGAPPAVSIIVSIALGTLAFVGIAYLVRALMGLQQITNLDYRAALGQMGDVYLTVPPKGEGAGKVSLTLGGSLSEYDAITYGRRIKTGESVRVIDVVRENVMVVEPENREDS